MKHYRLFPSDPDTGCGLEATRLNSTTSPSRVKGCEDCLYVAGRRKRKPRREPESDEGPDALKELFRV